MKFLLKYILFLMVLISYGKFGFTQDSSNGITGEIVMTKTELQSFLNKIAELKRQHIAQHDSARQVELKLKKFKKSYAPEDAQTRNNFPESELREYRNQEFSNSMRQYNPSYKQRLFTQLELINARLNSVMSEIELLKIKAALGDQTTSFSPVLPMGKSNQQQPQIRVEPKLQPVIINQESPPQIYANPGLQGNPAFGLKNNREEQPQEEQINEALLLARQNEQLILRNRIKSLENEMSLLQQLLKGAGEDEKNKYDEDIANLSTQIDSLSLQLEQRNREADSMRIKKQNSLQNVLNDFSYNVYFKNNSTLIPSSDYSKLQEIVNIAEQYPQATIVLRGFASKAGNPQYNEKISFQRAATVKKWLLSNGLNLKDIVTMHHGVDKSVDAARARRVEITFRVK